jgi:hypothetical protein
MHYELSYVYPQNSPTALIRTVLEKAGIEFIGRNIVKFPSKWNGDLQFEVAPHQKALRRFEKLRARHRCYAG